MIELRKMEEADYPAYATTYVGPIDELLGEITEKRLGESS